MTEARAVLVNTENRSPQADKQSGSKGTSPSLSRRIADFFFGYDFFVSYAHRDGLDYPRALAAALEARGFKVFLDEREYPPGEDLRIGTKRMVKKSRYFIVVARDFLIEREERDEANWVRREVEVCLRSRPVPVVIDVNGAFARASPTNRLRQLLLDRIFIEDTVIDPEAGPSDRVVQKLADGFKATRQEAIRLRWISFAALGLMLLAVVAAWQAWVAEERRVEAERQRDEAYSRLLTIEGRRLARDAPDSALLLAAAAVRIRPSPAAMDLLRTLLASEPRLERFLQGGGSRWRSAAFAADGSALLTAGADASVYRWQVRSDRLESQALESANRELLSSVALSPDGSRAAGGTKDGKQVLLWDTQTGKLERVLEADHRGPVEGLVFSPDASLLVSGGDSSATYLWNTASGAKVAQLDQHKSGVRAVAFAPDGGRVATAAEGRRIVIWSLGGTRPTHRVLDDGVPEFVFALAFSHDGRLAAGGQGEAVVVWALDKHEMAPVRLTGQHAGEVTQLRFTRDGAALAVRSRDGRLGFYAPSGGRHLRYAPIDAGPTQLSDFVFAESGRALLTVGPGNYVRRWSMDAPAEPMAQVLPGHAKGTNDVAFDDRGVLYSIGCPGPRAVAMDSGCSFGQEIRRWDAGKASAVGDASALGGPKAIRVAPRQDGQTLLLALAGGHLAVWDTVQNRVIEEYPRPRPPSEKQPKASPTISDSSAPRAFTFGMGISSLEVSSGLRRVAGNIPPPLCAVHNTAPDAIAISPHGDAFYYGGGGKGCVFRWKDGDNWAPKPLFQHGSSVSAIAISPDGSTVAVGGQGATFDVWRVTPNVERLWRNALAKGSKITRLTFSPGGDLLLVGIGTYEAEPRKLYFQWGRTVGSAMLWDVRENRLVSSIETAPPSMAGGAVSAGEFSPDGALAVVGGCRTAGGLYGCAQGELVFWDIASARQIGPPLAAHKGSVRAISLSEDGAFIATISESNSANNDPRILVWDMRPDTWIARACELVGRGFDSEDGQPQVGNLYPDPCAHATRR